MSASIGAQPPRKLCHASLAHPSRLSFIQHSSRQYMRRLTCRAPGQCTRGRRRLVQSTEARRNPLGGRFTLRTRQFSSTPSAYDAAASSVSPSEVAHFSRLASSWWDPHGPSRLLHLINPLRHDFIRSCLANTTSHLATDQQQQHAYLDVGCGGGIFASSAARLPSATTVTAIDPTPECIAAAQEMQRSDPALQPPKLTYLNCAIEELPADIGPVDILTLFEVLEHVPSPSTFLAECARHVAPGGWIIGSTIARSPVSFLTTKAIAEAPIIGVVPPGTHDWNKYINPDELRGWFEGKAGGTWGDFRTQGVIYLPILGWKVVQGSEKFGNYFFGVQKLG